MPKSIENCQVPLKGRLVDAMRSLERSAVEIALVIEDGILVGTLTDGDIRRALLKGAGLDSPLAPFVEREFTSVQPGAARAEVLDLMQARTIDQIPIVDSAGRLVGLHLMHELIGRQGRTNWAVIMAGGMGTRLRPITEHIPKPMILVAGRPILERLVLHLVGHGIRRIFLSINYLGRVVEEHFGDGREFGCQIEYLRELEPLGTGGALSLLPEKPAEPVLLLNGDLVTQFDVGNLLGFHAAGGYIATLGVSGYAHTVPFGCIEASGGRITRFEEKPVLTRHVNTGIYVLNPELIARVPAGKSFPVTALFEDSIQRGESLGACEIQDDWIDVGQREHLQRAQNGGA